LYTYAWIHYPCYLFHTNNNPGEQKPPAKLLDNDPGKTTWTEKLPFTTWHVYNVVVMYTMAHHESQSFVLLLGVTLFSFTTLPLPPHVIFILTLFFTLNIYIAFLPTHHCKTTFYHFCINFFLLIITKFHLYPYSTCVTSSNQEELVAE
jgi:hypothetical protein